MAGIKVNVCVNIKQKQGAEQKEIKRGSQIFFESWENVAAATHIKDRIEYDNSKTLEEAMRKENLCYEQNHKKESMANLKAKRNNNFEQKKKDFVPNRNFKNSNTRNFPSKNFQGNKSNSQTNPNGQINKEYVNNHSNYTKNFERKEPIKC